MNVSDADVCVVRSVSSVSINRVSINRVSMNRVSITSVIDISFSISNISNTLLHEINFLKE